MCINKSVIFFVYIFLFSISALISQKQEDTGSIPISIKDEGVDELKRGDVAMVFFITVTNIGKGKEFIRLHVNSSRCCQKIDKDDMDCESMRLYGGDMGSLKPQDFRNLTLVYSNLYLHERRGSCDVEITDAVGNVVRRTVTFDTTVVKDGHSLIPRQMEQYYSLADVSACDGVDQDPLKDCEPYECEVRYSGHRSYYNHTSKRCQPVSKCAGNVKAVAYIVETNTCKELEDAMTDFSEFHGGKPSVSALTQAHGYPINVQCHNGFRDPTGGRWCQCRPGWSSAPFDHASFDQDLQVYHMCTVWMGGSVPGYNGTLPTAKKTDHGLTNIIVFSMLGAAFLVLCWFLGWVLYKGRPASTDDDETDEGETKDEEGMFSEEDESN